MFKSPTIDFNAFLSPLGNSTCSSAEVVLAFLPYDGSTVHIASDRFVSCVYFFSVDFAFHPSPQTKIWSVRANFKQLYFHTLWELVTCLQEWRGFANVVMNLRPSLWSNGQSFWLQIQRSWVRSPALPDFLSSSGSGTGSTQPREPRDFNWGATWMKKKVAAPGLENRD